MNLPPVPPGKQGGNRTNGQTTHKEIEEIDKGTIQHVFGYFLLSSVTTTTTTTITCLLRHG